MFPILVGLTILLAFLWVSLVSYFVVREVIVTLPLAALLWLVCFLFLLAFLAAVATYDQYEYTWKSAGFLVSFAAIVSFFASFGGLNRARGWFEIANRKKRRTHNEQDW